MNRSAVFSIIILSIMTTTLFQNCGESINYDAFTDQSSLSSSSSSSSPSPLPPYDPPVIQTKTGDQTLETGENIILQASITGGGLSLQWYKDGALISGQTTNALSLSSVTTAQSGLYQLVAQNEFGTETASITLNVNAPPVVPPPPPPPSVAPVITQQIRGGTVIFRQSFSFSVKASGANLSYQWYKDDVAIAGAIGSNYLISNVNLGHAGTYKVQVSNPSGNVTSTAYLDVFYDDCAIRPGPRQPVRINNYICP